MKQHAWSLDSAGQAAIRRAEDGRTDAVPTLDELFAAVPWMMPKSVSGSSAAEPENKGDTMRADGLRTERVTLEITHSASDDSLPVRHWDWAKILTDGKAIYPRESVRVVEAAAPAGHRGSGVFDANGDEVPWEGVVAAITEERDAAIRERDEAKDECERLRGKVAAMEGQSRMDIEREIAVEEAWESCDIRQHWPDDEPGTSHRYAESMRLEIVRLRARVAELESAPAASGAANSPESPESSEPVALSISPAERDGLQAIDDGLRRHGNGFVVLPGSDSYRAVRSILDRHTTAPPAARGWLTEEERRLIEMEAKAQRDPFDITGTSQYNAAVLRSLLARSTPPMVKVPGDVPSHRRRDDQWIAAIREAGVEVAE